MSLLTVYDAATARAETRVRDADAIAGALRGIGVRFERWEAAHPLAEDASQQEILDAYRASVDRLTAEYGLRSADVVHVGPDHPDRVALRERFLSEHTHDDFEVRFFVDGRGLFYLHADAKVYALLCERGDLISIPAGIPHWFDMGERPHLKCIRLFTTPEGWVAKFTGDPLAARFPEMDAPGMDA